MFISCPKAPPVNWSIMDMNAMTICALELSWTPPFWGPFVPLLKGDWEG
jgi:hypothetical protein